MRYDVSFLHPHNPNIRLTICRYDCGSYFFRASAKDPLCKVSAYILQRWYPQQLAQLRQKAGVRRYRMG